MVNKSRLFALLILLNIACTANSVCTDNPVWASFKTWATSDTVGTNSDLTAGITSYETNTPVAVTDLGHCKQFNGQSTCCTAQLLNGVKKLVIDKTGKYQNKKVIFQQILNRLKGIALKCSGTDKTKVTQAPDNINKNDGPKAQIVTDFKKCYAKIIRAAAKFSRGNACAICVDPTKFADYFDSGKLKVQSVSFQSYLDEVKVGFDCINNLYSQFQTLVNDFFANYTDTSNTACTNAKKKITDYLTANPLCPSNDCTAKIAQALKVFGDGPENAPAQDDSSADSAIGTTALRRMLVTTYNEFSVVTTGGVETYISDSTDASISFDGISADYVAPSTTKPSFGGILLLQIISFIAILTFIL